MPEQMPFKMLRFIIYSSRDMRVNSKLPVCTAAIFDFPAKKDIVLKIKVICHLKHKTHEQMPFKFLGYLIYISRYEEKSEIVSLYGGNF